MGNALTTSVDVIRIERGGWFRRPQVEFMVRRGSDIRYVKLHEFESFVLRHSIDPNNAYVIEVRK